MVHCLSLLLLISSAFSRALALPRVERPRSVQQLAPTLEASQQMGQSNPLRSRSVEMDQTIASFTEQGLCFHYFAERPSGYPDPCIKYCENHDGHGYSGCDASSYANIDIEHGDQSIIKTDDDGFRWVPAPCECSNAVVEELATSIFEAVAEGLEKIDNVICAVWVETFKDILEVGVNFIPGGEALTVAGRAIQGAKTFAENGLEAADFFDNWVGKACGLPEWNFDLWTALLGGPDSLGKSVGCLRKNKSKCKRQDPVPEPPSKSHAEKPAPTDKTNAPSTESNARPTVDSSAALATSLPSSASSIGSSVAPVTSSLDSAPTVDSSVVPPTSLPSSAPTVDSSVAPTISSPSSAPTIDPSVAPSTPPPTTAPKSTGDPSTTSSPTSSSSTCPHGKRAGLVRQSNVISSMECNQGQITTHKYIITSVSYAANAPPLQVKATCKAAWNQACYHYSSVIRENSAFETLVCPPEAATVARKRVKTPKATQVWALAHDGGSSKKGVNEWKNSQHRVAQRCDMDEYPPAYLLTPRDQAYTLAGKHRDGQMVRWLPASDNQGAGSMWKGACFQAPLNELSAQQIVDFANDNTKNFGRKADRISPTLTEYQVGITVAQRPEFTIAQWDHAGTAGSQDDGLSENLCWPQAIAPLDPGFTILSIDRYYDNKVIPYDYRKDYIPGVNGYDPVTQQSGRVRRSLDFLELTDTKLWNSTIIE